MAPAQSPAPYQEDFVLDDSVLAQSVAWESLQTAGVLTAEQVLSWC